MKRVSRGEVLGFQTVKMVATGAQQTRLCRSDGIWFVTGHRLSRRLCHKVGVMEFGFKQAGCKWWFHCRWLS